MKENSNTTRPLNQLQARPGWPYKARALYAYDANPEDSKEASFVKGEILDVSNICGTWWPVKKVSGEEGMAPSNYLMLE
jgi:SHO1 osmosensor